MSNQLDHYVINEKDIDTVLVILRQQHPEATPEDAIELIEDLQASIHQMGHEEPEKLIEMYEDLQKQRALSRN